MEIGIYNWTTAENWYVVKSGGQAMNDFITFTNLTAGSYSVYIRNRGTSSLTTGYLLYHLSDGIGTALRTNRTGEDGDIASLRCQATEKENFYIIEDPGKRMTLARGFALWRGRTAQ